MVNVRPHDDTRFNVLLTEDREHASEHWTRQLPRLLRPQGVHAFITQTGQEAVQLIRRCEIHAAVIDLATPMHNDVANTSGPGGLWLLDVLRREPNNLPVVVVNSRAGSSREIKRFLNEALRRGAFSVINRPVQLEVLLGIIARVVDRQYDGLWPTHSNPNHLPKTAHE